MAPSWLKLVIILLLVVVLFGRGKIAGVMGDFAKGIKHFKRELMGGEQVQDAGRKTMAEPSATDADKHPATKV